MLLLVGCTKNADQQIMSEVTVKFNLPGTSIISMQVDMSLKGNYFRNFNTRQDYDIPVVVNNQCTMTVLKGLYIVAFDAVAICSDGTDKKVRCSAYSTANGAIALLDDEVTIELDVTEIK